MENNALTVLLTGGTGSLGLEIIKGLSADGINVVFTSRREDNIIKVEQLFNANATSAIVRGMRVDFNDDNYLEVVKNQCAKLSLWPSVLINNVRDLENLKVTNGQTDRKHFLGELRLGIIVPYELSMMMAFDEKFSLKSIINISSLYGVVPPNKNIYTDGYLNSPIQYGVSKAGLIHLTKELAVRLADKNINVNCISYGGVEGRADENFKQHYSKLVPQGRMLRKDEVVGPIKFFISRNSSAMTGQNIIVDGGYSIW